MGTARGERRATKPATSRTRGAHSVSRRPSRGTEATSRTRGAHTWIRVLVVAVVVVAMWPAGCASTPPAKQDDLCAVFKERPRWHRAAKDAERRWRAPIAVMMAVMQKESSYRHNAKPPRKKLLGVIPRLARESSAYGFAQATDAAWLDYQRSTGNRRAKRDKFADAVDFVGWYLHTAHQRAGIAKSDAKNQYLAYYSGIGGYQRGVWKTNAWLKGAAARVARRAGNYASQLAKCRIRR